MESIDAKLGIEFYICMFFLLGSPFMAFIFSFLKYKWIYYIFFTLSFFALLFCLVMSDFDFKTKIFQIFCINTLLFTFSIYNSIKRTCL